MCGIARSAGGYSIVVSVDARLPAAAVIGAAADTTRTRTKKKRRSRFDRSRNEGSDRDDVLRKFEDIKIRTLSHHAYYLSLGGFLCPRFAA